MNKVYEDYPNLKKLEQDWAWSIHKSICEEQILHEFITQTINYKKTLNTLQSRYKSLFIDSVEDESDNSIIIIFTAEQIKNLEDINKFMDSFGWYPAIIFKQGPYNKQNLDRALDNHNIAYIKIKYEPKFDVEAKVEHYLFHLTPDFTYKSKIQTRGLTPKTKSKISSHPERIYLLNPATRGDFEDVAYTLYDKSEDNSIKSAIQYYYLLRIDTFKIPDHKFYYDPNFYMAEGAVWTYQNIPTKAIEVVGMFEVNPNPTINQGQESFNESRNKFVKEFLGNKK